MEKENKLLKKKLEGGSRPNHNADDVHYLFLVSSTYKLFEIDKKNVSCDSVELLEDGQVFRCRNLRLVWYNVLNV